MVEMVPNGGFVYRFFALLTLLLGFLVCKVFVEKYSSPALVVGMSSSANSKAQVFFDLGKDFNDADSVSAEVAGNDDFRELRFPLPRKAILKLRLDPLRVPGTVKLRNMRIVEAGGTVRSFAPSEVKALQEIKEMVPSADQLLVQTLDKSLDSALLVPLERPLVLGSHFPQGAFLYEIALVYLPFWAVALILVVPALRMGVYNSPHWFRARLDVLNSLFDRLASRLSGPRWLRLPLDVVNSLFDRLANRLSDPEFIVFNRVAIWFYFACAVLFIASVAGDLNGSSMDFDSVYFHHYGPQQVLAGHAKGIRWDEWNFVTPDMFYLWFRPAKFDPVNTPSGPHYTSLLANMPVRHITMLFRPQFWGFFAFPLDYAFSFYWQMKWLVLMTGSFTLLLLLTRSSWLALAGALWLYFSPFTQWAYSWPSMLPEMCGMFCFVLVLAMYLTVGRSKIALAICSVLLAACSVNFAMFAYVPHLIPYVWSAVILFVGWWCSRRDRILSQDSARPRAVAAAVAVLLTAGMMFMFYRDAAPAITAISATPYPGKRSMPGGQFHLTQFISHYFAPVEDEARFPAATGGNICESAGFIWLAPVTLLCFGRIRSLSREQRILLACLWASALLLVIWDLVPIPAKDGRWLMLDKVQPQRSLAALGFLNMAIVMLVLSAPAHVRKLRLYTRLLITAVVVFPCLGIVNESLKNIFTWGEIGWIGAWLTVMASFIWDQRPRLFLATMLIPSIYLFGLINPISRGVGAVTNSALFQFVTAHGELKQARWLVISENSWFGLFTACGLDNYTGPRYLPQIDDYPIFEAHGVDSKELNYGGTLNAKWLEAGKQSYVNSPTLGNQDWHVNQTDPLVTDLGIRYIAYDINPTPAMTAGLKPLADAPVSGYWLYRIVGNK